MLAGVIALCVQPRRTESEPEPTTLPIVNDFYLWRSLFATTYAQRQIADTLMRVPKIKTEL